MMPGTVPIPTPIYRMVHIENLSTLLRRQGLHAPNWCPDDGLPYRTIHNLEIQHRRRVQSIPCGPGGVIHDYVPFYFGYRSPMLLQLHSGRVAGYTDGQTPLVYLVSTVQQIDEARDRFVFSDGHAIARITKFYDSITDLDQVDWDLVNAQYWKDTADDNDRQRRKQAEFLVHEQLNWSRITSIVTMSPTIQKQVEEIANGFPGELSCPITVRRNWYYD